MAGLGSTDTALIARVRARTCALRLAGVIEIMRPLPIEPIGGAPAGVLGLALIRGAPTVVVDPGALFAETAHKPTRFVTVAVGSRVVALAFDAVIGVRGLPAMEELPPLFGDADGHAIEAIGTLDSEVVVLLRAARLVPEELLRELDRIEGRA